MVIHTTFMNPGHKLKKGMPHVEMEKQNKKIRIHISLNTIYGSPLCFPVHYVNTFIAFMHGLEASI